MGALRTRPPSRPPPPPQANGHQPAADEVELSVYTKTSWGLVELNKLGRSRLPLEAIAREMARVLGGHSHVAAKHRHSLRLSNIPSNIRCISRKPNQHRHPFGAAIDSHRTRRHHQSLGQCCDPYQIPQHCRLICTLCGTASAAAAAPLAACCLDIFSPRVTLGARAARLLALLLRVPRGLSGNVRQAQIPPFGSADSTTLLSPSTAPPACP